MHKEISIASFSKLGTASISTENANTRLIDESILRNHKKYWGVTGFTVALMSKLIDSKGGHSTILGDSHKDLHKPHDLLELLNPFLDKVLGLYCTEKGEVAFSLREEFPISDSTEDDKFKKKRRGHPKTKTTGSMVGDAELVSEFLKQFSKKSQSDVQIDGPTDDEPYVVMMAPEAATLGKIGENGEIIGVVFTPVKSKNNRTVHGKVQLLFREKS